MTPKSPTKPATDPSPKVLHVAAEIFPLVKTGGLADVLGALPQAQADQGADIRLLLPGLPAVMAGVEAARTIVDIGPAFGALRVRLLLGRLATSHLPAYVVEAPYLYERTGGPYQDEQGNEWPDNMRRFALLGWVAAHLAAADADDQWKPDVLHAHDWHAALACAYAAAHAGPRAATVFTVHNLAFQGLFPMSEGPALGLPSEFLALDGLEFHGQISFMKAGLRYADCLTTVSPSYAREISTLEFGCGLDGVVRDRREPVVGILNGIDTRVWNPATDSGIASPFDATDLAGKRACRRALQAELGLDVDDHALLLTLVSRLTSQKGLDLVLQAMPGLLPAGVQLALQGTGDPGLESAFRALAQAHPGRVQVRTEYDEVRAHRLIAGADAIVVPSRFEPCGLTQMYGLRYGTVPIVRRVGGLGDTVREGPKGNGFVFDAISASAFGDAVRRAAAVPRDSAAWQTLLRAGMAEDLSWQHSARDYLALYHALVRGWHPGTGQPN